MSRIDRAQVLHVAALAHVSLADDEVPAMTAQLERILEHVAQLAEVDTEGVEPTAYGGVDRLPLRDDLVTPSLDRSRVLAAAPDTAGDGFVVPAFVED